LLLEFDFVARSRSFQFSRRTLLGAGLFAEKFGSTLDEALGNLVFLDWSPINPNRSEWIERFDRAIQL
jgi:hypothetical protein